MTSGVQVKPFAYAYAKGTAPEGYVCGTCGVSGVKLWREYQTMLEHQTLECCDCAGKSQKKDVSQIDADGKVPLHDLGGMRCDQIGWRVPAVPTEEGDTYWGYCSVPEPGCVWWRALPTRKAPVLAVADALVLAESSATQVTRECSTVLAAEVRRLRGVVRDLAGELDHAAERLDGANDVIEADTDADEDDSADAREKVLWFRAAAKKALADLGDEPVKETT